MDATKAELVAAIREKVEASITRTEAACQAGIQAEADFDAAIDAEMVRLIAEGVRCTHRCPVHEEHR